MGRKAVVALSVCLLALGLAAIVAGDDNPHREPTQVAATCGTASALVSWGAVTEPDLSGYDVYSKRFSASTYIRVNPFLVTATEYVVTLLSSGTSYDFGVVSVFNDGHLSAMSIPATCPTG